MLSVKDSGMPKIKRPTDAASNAVHVMRQLTGEIPRDDDQRNPAAVALGSLGGKARAKNLSKAKKKSIAKAAAKARWS